MRTVDTQVASDLVDFVFHQVKWRDFDESVHDARRLWADVESMPGVRTPPIERLGKLHANIVGKIAMLKAQL